MIYLGFLLRKKLVFYFLFYVKRFGFEEGVDLCILLFFGLLLFFFGLGYGFFFY